MKNLFKKSLSLLLAIVMIVGIFPFALFAYANAPADYSKRLTFDEPAADMAYTLQSGATLVQGREGAGQAINLAGGTGTQVRQHATFSNPSDFNVSGDFAISVWFYPRAFPVWGRVFDIGTGTSRYMFLAVSTATNGRNPRFAITTNGNAAGAEQIISSSIPVVQNAWNNVVITKTGTVATMYVNGEEAGRNTNMTHSPSVLNATASNSYLGRAQYSSDPYFNGMIDDFIIYDRALSEEEVLAINGIVVEPEDSPLDWLGLSVDFLSDFKLVHNITNESSVTARVNMTNPGTENMTVKVNAYDGKTIVAQSDPVDIPGGVTITLTMPIAVAGIDKLRIEVADPLGYPRVDAAYIARSAVVFPNTAPPTSTTALRSIHDPTLFKDPVSGKYYAYSTHNSIYESSDLINWSRHQNLRFYGTSRVPRSVADFISNNYSVTHNETYWAPDILYVENDPYPYWFYLSSSWQFGSRNSCMSLIKSTSPLMVLDRNGAQMTEGVGFIDAGIVLSSAENSAYRTNAIDAGVHTDNDGNNYFTWGSFWRGIMAVPMTDDGRLEDIDYTSDATIISSGRNFGRGVYSTPNGVGGPEGPNVVLNEKTGYRYLIAAQGDLASNYNTRIARSPLTVSMSSILASESAANNAFTDQNGRAVGSAFSGQTDRSTYWGYKMIGAYRLGSGTTYYANAHGTMLKDGEDWFFIHHTKETVGGTGVLTIRRVLWTDSGWPVVSAIPYAGETVQTIDKTMIYGIWDLASIGTTLLRSGVTDVGVVSTGSDNADTLISSSKIMLTSSGEVYNDRFVPVGSWDFDDDKTVTITFDENGIVSRNQYYKQGDVLKLFVLPGFDRETQEKSLSMTGTNQNEITQFLKKDNAYSASRVILSIEDDDIPEEPDIDPSLITPPVGSSDKGDGTYTNPFVFGDVPDMSIIRVGDAYWMSSTTMHMNPGVPIMRSYDLVNWETVSYVYNVMEDQAIHKLSGTSNYYSQGTWASSLRYKDGTFYLTVFTNTPNKTYIFQTEDPVNDPWRRYEINSLHHDLSVLMDDDGRNWLVWNANPLYIIELNEDMTGIKEGAERRTVIQNLHAPNPETGVTPTSGLAEGAQLEKINGLYYIFSITWPSGRPRSVAVHRSASLEGPWESRIVGMEGIRHDGASTGINGNTTYNGVAQGSIVQDVEGNWWGYAFRDSGPVGRAPWVVPITWEDGWPYFGSDASGTGSHTGYSRGGPKPVSGMMPTSVVTSDEFYNNAPKPAYMDSQLPTRVNYAAGEYDYNGSNLDLAWQWNHNPDNRNWSLTERPGWLRLTAMRGTATSRHILNARNTLTQRVFGPYSSAVTLLDVSNMRDGDEAGLSLFAARYGSIGIKMEGSSKFIVTTLSNSWSSGHATNSGTESARVELTSDLIYLKAEGDFFTANMVNDTQFGYFYYSYDGIEWTRLGGTLNMRYSTGNHFMGYRFALFNFAKTTAGGYVDFDFYRIGERLTAATTPTVLDIEMDEVFLEGGVKQFEVPITMDALPAGNYKEIVASIDIPTGFTVKNVVFGEGVSELRFFEVKGNQLLLTVTGTTADFKPVGGNGVFATIALELDDVLALPARVTPDVISVRGVGNEYVVYDVNDVFAEIDGVVSKDDLLNLINEAKATLAARQAETYDWPNDQANTGLSNLIWLAELTYYNDAATDQEVALALRRLYAQFDIFAGIYDEVEELGAVIRDAEAKLAAKQPDVYAKAHNATNDAFASSIFDATRWGIAPTCDAAARSWAFGFLASAVRIFEAAYERIDEFEALIASANRELALKEPEVFPEANLAANAALKDAITAAEGVFAELLETNSGGISGALTALEDALGIFRTMYIVVWYKFNETGGTTAFDSSGNGYHATMMNGASFTGTAASLAGSTLTDASGQYINLPTNILETVPGDFTISTWMMNRASGQQQWIRVFDFGPGSTQNIMFLTARDFQFNMDNANPLTAPTASRPNNSANVNQWMHVTITRSGNTTRMYVNGAQVATSSNQTSTAPRVPTSGGFYIGRANWADQYANMQVRDFRLYARALSATEVQDLYTGVNTYPCDTAGHSFVAYEVVTAATCEKDGEESALCEYGCGTTDTRVIPADPANPCGLPECNICNPPKEDLVLPKHLAGLEDSYNVKMLAHFDFENLPTTGTAAFNDITGNARAQSRRADRTAVANSVSTQVPTDGGVHSWDFPNTTTANNRRWLDVTKHDGTALLLGDDGRVYEEIVVSYDLRRASGNWAFYFDRNTTANASGSGENYIGAFWSGNNQVIERFRNGRPGAAYYATAEWPGNSQWVHVDLVIRPNSTELWFNGTLRNTAPTANDTYKISNITGSVTSGGVIHLGRANWGTNGEYIVGQMDNVQIFALEIKPEAAALDSLDIPAILEGGFVLPATADDYTLTWTSSSPSALNGNTIVAGSAMQFITLTASAGGVSKDFAVAVLAIDTDLSGVVMAYENTSRPWMTGQAMYLGKYEDGVFESYNFDIGVLFAEADYTSPTDEGNGTTRGLINPWIFRMKDGKIGVLAQKANTGRVDASPGDLLLWTTEDLVKFSPQRLIHVAAGAINAPQAYYDAASDRYIITWMSSTGMMVTTTEDFNTFSGAAGDLSSERFAAITLPGKRVTSMFDVTAEEKAYLDRRLGEIKNTTVDKPDSISAAAGQGISFANLPDTVTAHYTDGTSAEKAVAWDQASFNAVDFTTPGVYPVTGNVIVKDYSPFPLVSNRADPDIIQWDGKYYFIATQDGGTGHFARIDIRVADTLEGIRTAPDNRILDVASTGSDFRSNLWAPEFHIINGKLTILFAAATATSGRFVNGVQCRYMELTGTDPTNRNHWSSPVRFQNKDGGMLADETQNITLDMTYFEDNGVHYVMWAQRRISGGSSAGASNLWIGTIDPAVPYRLTSDPVMVYRNTFGWERTDNVFVAEGAYMIKHGDDLFVTFSGGPIGALYVVGVLKAKAGTDLLDPGSWEVVGYPILDNQVAGEVGPGHNAYTVDEYGRDVIVYHARYSGNGDRNAGLRTVHWDFEGLPVLYMTPEREVLPGNRTLTLEIVVTEIVTPPEVNYDINRDGAVDYEDLAFIMYVYGSKATEVDWNSPIGWKTVPDKDTGERLDVTYADVDVENDEKETEDVIDVIDLLALINRFTIDW